MVSLNALTFEGKVFLNTKNAKTLSLKASINGYYTTLSLWPFATFVLVFSGTFQLKTKVLLLKVCESVMTSFTKYPSRRQVLGMI